MYRTNYYKLDAIANASALLSKKIKEAYQTSPPFQPPHNVTIELYCETAEYVLQALRIGLGEMSK